MDHGSHEKKIDHSSMGHHGPPKVTDSNERALKIVTWLTGIYFVVELVIGIYSGSISVLSDAFHTFSAVGGVLLALIAARLTLRPSDKHNTFGLFRAEIIGALFNGLFLLLMALFVLFMGYQRLQNPIRPETDLMFVAAFGGLITEVIAIKLLYSGQKDNLNIKGAFWHVLQTFVGSLIIIVAAIVIHFTDFVAIDPILGILFGLVLLYASYGIIKESLIILLETVPKNIDLDEVKESLESIKGVKNIHHIHAWVLTSGKNIFSTHIQIEDLSKSQKIFKEAHKIIKEKYNFYFATIQIEKECTDEGEARHIDITK